MQLLYQLEHPRSHRCQISTLTMLKVSHRGDNNTPSPFLGWWVKTHKFAPGPFPTLDTNDICVQTKWQRECGFLHVADLGEDVLFPHELLPLPVGCGGDHRQNILSIVRHHTHKEDQVLQELSHKPEKCMNEICKNHKVSTSSTVKWHWACGVFLYLLSFWVMLAFWKLFTVDSKTLFASLAKSKSLTSERGTDTMANASLSSLVGQVPIYCDSKKTYSN